jgi:hypothetical protein
MANFQLGDTEQVSYGVTVLDADSNPAVLLPTDVVSATSSSASMTVVPDATPAAGTVASGQLLGTAALATGVVFTVSITGSVNLTATDLIDIVGGPASSISIALGTPVAQGATSSFKK